MKVVRLTADIHDHQALACVILEARLQEVGQLALSVWWYTLGLSVGEGCEDSAEDGQRLVYELRFCLNIELFLRKLGYFGV